MKIGVPVLWDMNWGKLDWLRKWLIQQNLKATGHWTMCGHCYRYSLSYYCDCLDQGGE